METTGTAQRAPQIPVEGLQGLLLAGVTQAPARAPEWLNMPGPWQLKP